jgi:hypothetical protein
VELWRDYWIDGTATFDNGIVVVGDVMTKERQKALAIYVKRAYNK